MMALKIMIFCIGFFLGLIFGKIIFEQVEQKKREREKGKRLEELTDRELSRVRDAIDNEMLRRLFGEDVKRDDGPFEEFNEKNK